MAIEIPAVRENGRTIIAVVLVAAGLVWLFMPTMSLLFERWRSDPGSSHGPLIPLISAVLLWTRRAQIQSVPREVLPLGIVVICIGLLLQVLAAWADVRFLFPVSMLVAIWGLVLYLLGWMFVKQILFPLVFPVFAVPWPDFLVEAVSFPLQIWTSTYAAMAAGMLGIPVTRNGVELTAGHFTLEVAAPCSGIRSLVALMAVSAVFAYLLPAAMPRRLLLFLAGIPVALVANTIRVLAIMVIAWQFGPRIALGFFHDYSSPFLFILACMGMMGLRKILECQTPDANPTT